MESSSSTKHKKIKNNNKSNLSKEGSGNYSATISDELLNTSSHASQLSDISTANMSEWAEKSKIAIQNIKVKSSKSISSSNNNTSENEQSSLSALSDISSVFMENPKEKSFNKEKSFSSEDKKVQKREVKKMNSKTEFSTSEGGDDVFQSDASTNGWKAKNIEAIANTPIFNKKRFYGDGETSEEFQSSEKFSELDIIEEEEEVESQDFVPSDSKEREAPILDVGELSSASSIDTGDVPPFDDAIAIPDQSSKTRKKKKVKKVKKNKNTNSSASYIYETASETLSNNLNDSESKRIESPKVTPRGTFSRFEDMDSNGSKIYFNSETSDAPAVSRIKKKIDNLISPHKINTPNSTRGIRVQYTDEEIISPRRKQKVAQIFIEGDSDEIEYSSQIDSTVFGRLSDEKYPHNVNDSELSDISLVDFDTPKVKYQKSPTKDALYRDSDFAFKKDQMKIENDSFSSNSLPYKSRDVDLGISIGSDDEISNDDYEKAQRKIEKYAIEDSEVQENGALFDIKIPDNDEEGKLLLDLKKNAIMLSSSSSQESSDVEDEDKLEMLGELIVNRGLPLLKLSDSESEGDPFDRNENIQEEEEKAESNENINTFQNEEDSEPPIIYDPLLAPKSLTTPRSTRTPRTPNETVYTGNLILTITVIEATNLPRSMPKIRLEPYVLFKLKGSKEYKKTKTCHYTKNNSGSNLISKSLMNSDVYSFDNQKLVFVIDPNQQNILTIKVRDEDKFGGDVDISGYDFVLSSLKIGESDGWFRLTPIKNVKKGGKLHVQFNLEREVKPEPPHTPKSPKSPKNNKSNSSQISEHSQKSHHSKKSENSELSQISLGSNNTETESMNDDDIDIDNFSSISEGNSKKRFDKSLSSLSESENNNEKGENLNSLSDPLDSPVD